MTRTLNIALQLLALLVHILNYATTITSVAAKPWIHLSILAVQGVVAIIASNYNPDGTPATVGYRPKPNPKDLRILGLAMLIFFLTISQTACSAADYSKALKATYDVTVS